LCKDKTQRLLLHIRDIAEKGLVSLRFIFTVNTYTYFHSYVAV
jgi:hypothetical protein